MNYEVEINKLWYSLNCLQEAFIQSQINETPIVSMVDDTSNRVNALTPYTDTKEAYYGETQKTFYDVPTGNISVYFNNYEGAYKVERIETRVIVSFDKLENATTITISVQ